MASAMINAGGRHGFLIRPPRRILVAVFQGLGDLVLAIPALRAIRRRFPESRISVTAWDGAIDILAHEPFIDELIPVAQLSSGGAYQQLMTLLRTTSFLRKRRFELLINLTTLLHPGTYLKARLFNLLCSTRDTVAGSISECVCAWPKREKMRIRLPIHETQMKFLLMHGLVGAETAPTPTLTVGAGDGVLLQRIRDLAGELPILAVCPGGARRSRQWPAERFIETVGILMESRSAFIVILGGKAEKCLAARITRELGSNILDLTGVIPIRWLATLIAICDCVLANDTGILHVAAAVGTPFVGLSGADAPSRYAPVRRSVRSMQFYRPYPCSPCNRNDCRHRRCMAWIEPREVARQIRICLGDTRRQKAVEDPMRHHAESGLSA